MRYLIYLTLISLTAATHIFGQEPVWQKINVIDTIAGYNYALEKMASAKYGPNNLFDSNLKTCWVTGESPIYLRIPENTKVLNVFNGYGKSSKLYQQNARAKKIVISYYLGLQPEGHVSEIAAEYYLHNLHLKQEIEFMDVMGIRHISLYDSIPGSKANVEAAIEAFTEDIGYDVNEVRPIIKIAITDTYPGNKYDDICLSELFFSDKYMVYHANPQISTIDSIYINEEENALLAQRKTGHVQTLYKNFDEVVWLSELSKNKEWVIIMTMPVESRGRGLSTFLLINTKTNAIVNDDLQAALGISVSEIFLEYQGDALVLRCTDVTTNAELIIKLNEE